jgi:hypothetical protein
MPWHGGWGFSQPHKGIDEKFCGRACLSKWEQGVTYTQDEIQAFQEMLPLLGKAVAAQGIGAKAFNDLSRDEALAFAAATVRAFREAFAEVVKGGVPF